MHQTLGAHEAPLKLYQWLALGLLWFVVSLAFAFLGGRLFRLMQRRPKAPLLRWSGTDPRLRSTAIGDNTGEGSGQGEHHFQGGPRLVLFPLGTRIRLTNAEILAAWRRVKAGHQRDRAAAWALKLSIVALAATLVLAMVVLASR